MQETPQWFKWLLAGFVALILLYLTATNRGFGLGVVAAASSVALSALFITLRGRLRDRGARAALRILFVYGFLALATFALAAPTSLYFIWLLVSLALGALELVQRQP